MPRTTVTFPQGWMRFDSHRARRPANSAASPAAATSPAWSVSAPASERERGHARKPLAAWLFRALPPTGTRWVSAVIGASSNSVHPSRGVPPGGTRTLSPSSCGPGTKMKLRRGAPTLHAARRSFSTLPARPSLVALPSRAPIPRPSVPDVSVSRHGSPRRSLDSAWLLEQRFVGWRCPSVPTGYPCPHGDAPPLPGSSSRARPVLPSGARSPP